MNINLIFCIAGIFFYICIIVFYCTRISAKKAEVKKSGGTFSKAEPAFISSVILCGIVEFLPFLIPLKTYVIAIVILCGLFGSVLVFKERLEKL